MLWKAGDEESFQGGFSETRPVVQIPSEFFLFLISASLYRLASSPGKSAFCIYPGTVVIQQIPGLPSVEKKILFIAPALNIQKNLSWLESNAHA